MNKLICTALLLVSVMSMKAQTSDLFSPYKETDLRLPSVPLVVSDPYFSIWSPYNTLNEGSTRHWTDDEKPLEGILRVDGKSYRFLGTRNTVLETIVPMADEGPWKAAISRKNPGKGWEKPDFNDSEWHIAEGAFGSPNLSYIRTRWDRENSDLYVRRTVELTPEDLEGDLFVVYSHDDVFNLYLNGTKIADTGETWREGVRLELTPELKKLLHPGKNVIASHCHNTTGGAYTDFGIYRNISAPENSTENARQNSVNVMATSSYYNFTCGPVELDLVFTAPMLIHDYDLLSSPINYISYQVKSTDGKPHDVKLLLTASPLIAQNKPSSATVSTFETIDGVDYVRTGTVEQPILAKTGDHICIDWGYLYLPSINGEVSLNTDRKIKSEFFNNGRLPKTEKEIVAHKSVDQPMLAYMHDFGTTTLGQSYAMIGYDEIYDIEYFFKRYKGYWAHNGNVSITDMFRRLSNSYASIMKRCQDFDKTIYDDAFAVGGKKYAEILSGSYRHVIAAHKLFQDDKGNLLFFSKENDSNGCVNTVDLTYPEAPLFLCYNPELQKAMMTSILDYSKSGRWTKPFAAHDLGQYPKANGQVYGGDMPLEEGGNMLTLIAQVCKLDGNVNYALPYWDILQTWTDYLAENGQDPENQLCTDDFAGHWAHNANLSIKAIMGVAGFAELADLKGDAETAKKYRDIASGMARRWEADAREGSKGDLHYRLAFDRENTWSQKYNMVWDKLWQTNLFPNNAMLTEVNYYLKKQNEFGLPLDSRKDYTKSDWIMWTAAMSPDQKTLSKFVDPLYNYVHRTETRVPISDWYDTVTGRKTGFMARSVIGGHWMPLFAHKLNPMPEK
ncbi:MAG: DUF4965 domain-containing protein [Clostridium sp.]|nr:DUF4965 domain-containing protein [Clostridium sp.]